MMCSNHNLMVPVYSFSLHVGAVDRCSPSINHQNKAIWQYESMLAEIEESERGDFRANQRRASMPMQGQR